MLKKLFKSIDLTFENPKIECEYQEIKKRDSFRDYQINVIALVLVTLTIAINLAAKHTFSSTFVAAVIVIGVLIVVSIVGNFFRKHIEYFTIGTLLAYNIYRIIFLHNEYPTIGKMNMFFGGYTYAVFQIALISRIPKFLFKILVVAFLYVVRFVVFIYWIDITVRAPDLIIRILILDVFILCFFYINEKSERRVFQTFSENQEELLKFKELLDESLPQSVSVMSCETNKYLFANKAFKETFDSHDSEVDLYNPTENISTQIFPTKIHFNLLQVDLSTIRDKAISKVNYSGINLENNLISLKKFISKLASEDVFKEKTLSLAASYSFLDQRRSFEVNLKRVKWNREDVIAVILNDITYQENLITLKTANINKDKILATVSHELKTPLHGIIGLISMAEEKVSSIEVSECLSLGRNNAYLLLGLVNSIVDFHQISTGKLVLSPSTVDLTKALTDIVRLFQFQSKKKAIGLGLFVDKSISPHVITDERRLKQILINLVGNAIKFTRKGGVKIEVVQDNDIPECLEISVIDTGIGIKEEDKKNLFKMGGRMEDVASVNKNGVGLGLTISDALARLLDDRGKNKGIQVISKYTEGSRFSFRILKDLSTANKINSNHHVDGPRNAQQSNVKLLGDIQKAFLANNNSNEPSDDQIEDFSEDSFKSIKIVDKVTNYISQTKVDINGIHNSERKPPKDNENFQQFKESNEIKFQQLRGSPVLSYLKHEDKLISLQNDENNLLSFPQEHDQDRNGESGWIIVVDDNAFNLLVAENLIKDYKYSIKTALGGHEAIDLVNSFCTQGEKIKAILMDCQMPVIDGYETTKILKQMMQRKQIPEIPIIAWTANHEDKDIQRCFDCGMSDYLSKPTSKEAIRRAFSKLKE